MDRLVTPLTKGPPPLGKQPFKHQRREWQRKRLTKNEYALFHIPSFLFHPGAHQMMGSCSISFNCQMLANFSGVEFQKTVPKIKKKKWNRFFVFTSFIKSEIRQFHVAVVQQRQRNVQKNVLPVQSCCQSKAEAKRGTFHETNQTWWVKFMKISTGVWLS